MHAHTSFHQKWNETDLPQIVVDEVELGKGRTNAWVTIGNDGESKVSLHLGSIRKIEEFAVEILAACERASNPPPPEVDDPIALEGELQLVEAARHRRHAEKHEEERQAGHYSRLGDPDE